MNLKPALTPGSRVTPLGAGAWQLEIPPGPGGRYRLAQLDDYRPLARHQFKWQPPLRLELQTKASQQKLPGTWGFGFWNDPFNLSLGFGGGQRRFPALPNAAWFFYASPQNYLSLRDDLPASGLLAATFRSPAWPPALLGAGIPLLPLLTLKSTARWLRHWGRRLIQQDATQLPVDVTQWHRYALEWHSGGVSFEVDGTSIFETAIAPRSPLGFVLWIDNQYAAFPSDGKLAYGTLENQAVMELVIRDLSICAVRVGNA